MGIFRRYIFTAFENDDSRSKWRWFLLLSVGLGMAVVVLRFGGRNLPVIGAALLLAGASLFTGLLTGFLFGIPKTVQRRVDAATGGTLSEGDYQPNTNLEEISDWLTKMLVGLGLVQLKELPDLIDQVAEYWSGSLAGAGKPFAAAVLVYFTINGFLIGYLWTRLALVGDFIEKDPRRLISELLNRVAKTAEANPSATMRSPEREVVTAQELDAAQKLASLSAASRVSIDDLRRQLRVLATQYEALRASMPSGPERTRRMEVIASQMRTFCLAAYPLLSEFANSPSAGDRLVAITFLQTRPNPDFFTWLADRLNPSSEAPFIGYHAAVALQHAARTVSPEQWDRLDEALDRAFRYIGDVPDTTDRVAVLKDAREILRAKRAAPNAQA